MRYPIIAVVLLGAAASAAEPPREKPSADVPNTPTHVEFDPPAQTIPETAKTPPPNEGTSKTPAKTDAEIGRAIEKSLLDDPAAPRVEGLAISIVDGKVTVRGRVATQADKDRVTAKAGAAAGLRNVANELEVRAP